ncbi:MAG: hypothetical protein KI792_14385 [Alphaproteobacteria bacterium]|nr:hypothetical protein [Alphaproteobacteria bacterium SS10]
MTGRVWTKALALAAASAVGNPAAAQNEAATETYDIRAEWLDPAVVDHPKAHDRIMTELANHYPVSRRTLDELGLNSAAASAFAEARNRGDLFLKLNETDREWWKDTQPQLEQIMDDYRTRERNRSLAVLGTIGVAGAGGLAAWKIRRRRKDKTAETAAPSGPKRSP